VKKVWIGQFTDGIWGAVGATTPGEIDDSTDALALEDFVSPKNTSSLTQTVNSSVENGTVFYSQVLSLVCNKPVAADVVEIQNLAKGRLAVVVQDMNDNYFVIGHTRGAEMTGGTIASGTALGDLNGFTLEFTGEEAIPAPFLDATSAAAGNVNFNVTP
tara:strand:+ start:1135 stop:1611 length:477 start_codon:yes stop_codon:yes gene_type:complete